MSGLRLSRVSALGKVRSEREFLRAETSPALQAFDSWLTESMAWAAQNGGARFPQSFARGALNAFVFRAEHGVLAGTLAPSADESGRLFPVSVVAELETPSPLASAPELLPVVLEQLWDASAELVFDARERGESPLPRLAGIERALPADLEQARAAYGEWLKKCTLPEFLELCAVPASHFATSMAILADAVRPHRGLERPNTPLSFRLPLGHGGGAAVCFWLDVVRRLMAWNDTIPSFFWTADDHRARLIVHLGDAPRSTLAALWGASGTRDELCDLVSVDAADANDAHLAPALAAAIASPTTTLFEVLQVLASEPEK